MANFTRELRKIPKNEYDLALANYPIYDETYRLNLNDKIYQHYYMREIGTETVDMFLFFLRRKMNEIMPYYNQLYKSAELKFDPLTSMGTTTESESDSTSKATREQTDEGTSKNTSNNTSRVVNSNLPQVRLAGNNDYATSAVDTIGEGKGSNSGTQKSNALTDAAENGKVKSSTKGYLGSPADLLQRYRNTMLNIDMMVIDELEMLFMQIWSDNSEFFSHRRYF